LNRIFYQNKTTVLHRITNLLAFTLMLLLAACQTPTDESQGMEEETSQNKIPVLFDTDANNELDDQHAMAYLLYNGDVFDVKGITVNRTFNGGGVAKHKEEAERILQLSGLEDEFTVHIGADSAFEVIRSELSEPNFDGAEAVNLIIEQARAMQEDTLILLPVGKLTNIALALEKAPDIADKVRIVWLGSNYPEPGEYNQINDTAALNYLLDTEVDFEIVTVRYGKPSGTDAVRVTPSDAQQRLAGKGIEVSAPVTGRHGGTFTNFGDYAVNLFEHIDLHGDPPSRALFDMVAVAILKNPDWGETTDIPAPKLVNGEWVERPDNPRTITLWENFDAEAILEDFYETVEEPVLVGKSKR